MEILIRELTRPEQPALLAHFLALDGNDRRLRFGAALSERALRHYVERINFDHDAVFGVGDALLARAHLRARNWGVRALFVHCLAENAAMMRLARRYGMQIGAHAGEADAWLRLPPADAASHFGEVFAQRVALFDYALKSHAAAGRRLAAALTSGTASPVPGR
ncbi:MAG: GNAT family N-acetyltransferase [Alphaproteobacteria bacterium]|nr:GNAT family N-acetyltransferase [Alphaproteobacteria bacterium]